MNKNYFFKSALLLSFIFAITFSPGFVHANDQASTISQGVISDLISQVTALQKKLSVYLLGSLTGASSFNLTVTRSGTGTGTVTTNPATIQCGFLCTVSTINGFSMTLIATPASGSTFAGWTGACSGTGSCPIVMNENKSVGAIFNVITAPPNTPPPVITLTASPTSVSPGQISALSWSAINATSCTASEGGSSPRPATSSIAVTPSITTTYTLTCIGPGGSSTASTTVTVTVSPPSPPATFALLVIKSGNGTGTVTSSPAGINCGSTCLASVGSGSSITLIATPDSGSEFAGWTGACSGTTSCVVAMRWADHVGAIFNVVGTPPPTTPSTFSLTVTKSGAGTGTVISAPAGINCGSTCFFNYASGTSVTLTPIAASGSVFAGWEGMCGGTNPSSCAVLMNSSYWVRATFNLDPNSPIAPLPPLPANPLSPPTATFTVNPSNPAVGTPVTITWKATNAVSATATFTINDGFTSWPWPTLTVNDKELGGSATFIVADDWVGNTYAYTYTARNAAGQTATATALLAPIAAPAQLSSPTLPNPPPPQVTSQQTPPPSLIIYVNPNPVAPKKDFRITWDSNNAVSCAMVDGATWGYPPSASSIPIRGAMIYRADNLWTSPFTISCRGLDGQVVTKSVTVEVANNTSSPTPTPTLTPTPTTTPTSSPTQLGLLLTADGQSNYLRTQTGKAVNFKWTAVISKNMAGVTLATTVSAHRAQCGAPIYPQTTPLSWGRTTSGNASLFLPLQWEGCTLRFTYTASIAGAPVAVSTVEVFVGQGAESLPPPPPTNYEGSTPEPFLKAQETANPSNNSSANSNTLTVNPETKVTFMWGVLESENPQLLGAIASTSTVYSVDSTDSCGPGLTSSPISPPGSSMFPIGSFNGDERSVDVLLPKCMNGHTYTFIITVANRAGEKKQSVPLKLVVRPSLKPTAQLTANNFRSNTVTMLSGELLEIKWKAINATSAKLQYSVDNENHPPDEMEKCGTPVYPAQANMALPNQFAGSTIVSISDCMIGHTYRYVYSVENTHGNDEAILFVTVMSSNLPTATLLANGKITDAVTVNVGDTLNLAWDSKKATEANLVAPTNISAGCPLSGGGHPAPRSGPPWTSPLSGNMVIGIPSCAAGRDFQVTFEVRNSFGTAKAVLNVSVINPQNQSSLRFTANDRPGTVTANVGTTVKLEWSSISSDARDPQIDVSMPTESNGAGFSVVKRGTQIPTGEEPPFIPQYPQQPIIKKVTPLGVNVGSRPITITIDGENFLPHSSISFVKSVDNEPYNEINDLRTNYAGPTTYVSSNQLKLYVPSTKFYNHLGQLVRDIVLPFQEEGQLSIGVSNANPKCQFNPLPGFGQGGPSIPLSGSSIFTIPSCMAGRTIIYTYRVRSGGSSGVASSSITLVIPPGF